MPEEDIAKYTVRLRVRDVEAIKVLAKSIGATWTGYLRVLVKDALEKGKKEKVIR